MLRCCPIINRRDVNSIPLRRTTTMKLQEYSTTRNSSLMLISLNLYHMSKWGHFLSLCSSKMNLTLEDCYHPLIVFVCFVACHFSIYVRIGNASSPIFPKYFCRDQSKLQHLVQASYMKRYINFLLCLCRDMWHLSKVVLCVQTPMPLLCICGPKYDKTGSYF